MSLQLPTKYSRVPIPVPPGSLGGTLAAYTDGVQNNLNQIATSINQAIQCLSSLDKADIALAGRVKLLEAASATQSAAIGALQTETSHLSSLNHDYLLLTAAPGGSTWALSAQAGYPYLRAIIIDPNGEANTLTLPTLGVGDKAIFTIKCLASSGNVVIDGGAAQIITSAAPGGTILSIPFALVADGVTISTYGVTIIWTGAAWHVIDTAILTV